MAEGQAAPAAKDTRYDWIQERVCSSLKVREEQFQKLLQGEAKASFANFLEDADTKRLLVFLDGKDLGVVRADEPCKQQGQVAHGELTEAPLETLSAVAQHVFLPLLTTSSNQEGWPDVVAKEVSDNLHRFVANVNATLGQLKGQTLLPLPAADTQQQDQAAKDKAKIHILESAVMTWTKQIKSVLRADPDAALKDVESARQEASENVRFLQPLRRFLEKLNTMDDFVALADQFKPLLHVMLLIWKHSSSYSSSARFATLLREVCNDLIMQARKYIPGAELLQMDPNEACDKLRIALKVLGSFKSHYFAYKAVSAGECPSSPWRFQNSIIFGRLDTFLERCADVMELQSTCLQFGRLERVEVGGTKGKSLTSAIKQVHTDFLAAHEKF
ncbi:dynein heavy chain, N-terminal region 1-domain-containing protein, partial [Scenedesmus sp. NREL 46B-D3]